MLSDGDSKKGRNYEDLKAKLGLRKTSQEPAAPVSQAEDVPFSPTPEIGEPPGERTPAGGFDLGLERGGTTLDSPLIDIEKSAARMGAVDAGEFTIKRSKGTQALLIGIMVAGVVAALFIGKRWERIQTDKYLADKQTNDATTLHRAVAGVKLGEEPLGTVVDGYVADVLATKQKVREIMADKGKIPVAMLDKHQSAYGNLLVALKSPAPEMLADLETALSDFATTTGQYINKGPVLNAELTIGDQVYAATAARAVMKYANGLREQMYLAKQFYNAEAKLLEHKSEVGLSKLVLPPVPIRQAFRIATSKDSEGRRIGALVRVSYVMKDDKPQYKKTPVEVPKGMKLREGAPTHTDQVLVRYKNPEQFGLKDPEAWVDVESIAATEFKVEVDDMVKATVKDQVTAELTALNQSNRVRLLGRLMMQLQRLEENSKPIPALQKSTMAILTKASGK